jgi:hypothetical protein
VYITTLQGKMNRSESLSALMKTKKMWTSVSGNNSMLGMILQILLKTMQGGT